MANPRKKALVGERSAAFSRGEIRVLGAAVVIAAATSLVLSVLSGDGLGGSDNTPAVPAAGMGE